MTTLKNIQDAVGKTIKNIDDSNGNVWVISFSDDSKIEIWAETKFIPNAGNLALLTVDIENF